MDLHYWAGSLLEAKVVGCWCGCLSEARCRQLCDLHNYKLYDLHAIFYSRLSVSKSIFMFSWVIIFLLFLEAPLLVEAPGQLRP